MQRTRALDAQPCGAAWGEERAGCPPSGGNRLFLVEQNGTPRPSRKLLSRTLFQVHLPTRPSCLLPAPLPGQGTSVRGKDDTLDCAGSGWGGGGAGTMMCGAEGTGQEPSWNQKYAPLPLCTKLAISLGGWSLMMALRTPSCPAPHCHPAREGGGLATPPHRG